MPFEFIDQAMLMPEQGSPLPVEGTALFLHGLESAGGGLMIEPCQDIIRFPDEITLWEVDIQSQNGGDEEIIVIGSRPEGDNEVLPELDRENPGYGGGDYGGGGAGHQGRVRPC